MNPPVSRKIDYKEALTGSCEDVDDGTVDVSDELLLGFEHVVENDELSLDLEHEWSLEDTVPHSNETRSDGGTMRASPRGIVDTSQSMLCSKSPGTEPGYGPGDSATATKTSPPSAARNPPEILTLEWASNN